MPRFAYSYRDNFESGSPLQIANSREEAIVAALEEFGPEEVWIAPLTEISLLPVFAAREIFLVAQERADVDAEHLDRLSPDHFDRLRERLEKAFAEWIEAEGLVTFEIGKAEHIQDFPHAQYQCIKCGTVNVATRCRAHDNYHD